MEDLIGLIGKKVRGFKFEGDYASKMNKHIGKIGEIISVNLKKTIVRVEFTTGSWCYPADQIEKHLVKEIMEKFKIGDIVQCVESGVVFKPCAMGYKPGKQFIVESIHKSSDGAYIYFPKDALGVYECDLILVKTLPKSFGCTNTNQELWDKYISWLNKEYDNNFMGKSSYCPYYGIGIYGELNNYSSKDAFDTILSLEEWDEIVNGTQTKKEETMKNYTITREQLKEIHDVACLSWRDIILEYSKRNSFGNTIEFTQKEVDAMFKAAITSQTPVLENIFGKQTAEIDLSTGIVDGKGLFDVGGYISNVLMCVRTCGKYANKAFVLNYDYDWELVKDVSGHLCLVPTRKK